MENDFVNIRLFMKKLIIGLFVLLAFGCNSSKSFEDYKYERFMFNDRDAIIVVPDMKAEGNPWIWRPAYFGAFPSVDLALLEKGFHVVYYDLTHLYGCPRSMDLGTDFYSYVVRKYELSPKVTLEGFSRGGLFVFNWAEENADKVACIYVDAPVCNVFSWPGKESELWNDVLREWNLSDEDMENFTGNPIDNLQSIAASGIPIIAVCGDSDEIVPYKDNMALVYSKYTELGGKIEVILKEGVGHHPHSLDNPERIVNFIVENQ